jgi:type I restriction enzyme R subunit
MNQTSSNVWAREISTQKKAISRLQDDLWYAYLGDWTDRKDNSNIETELLTTYLVSTKKYSEKLIQKAIDKLEKVANYKSKEIY